MNRHDFFLMQKKEKTGEILPYDERNRLSMKLLHILPEYMYAGYCSTNGNKVWAACLAIEMDHLKPLTKMDNSR